MLNVRHADPFDAAQVAEILDDVGVLQAAAEPEALTRQRLRGQIERTEAGDHDVFVAEREDVGVIGFAAVSWTQNLRMGVDGLVSDLFVRSDVRGEGAGSALIDRVKREARARGCARLLLYSGREGDAYERSFYPKMGFAEHDELAFFILPVPPDLQ
ncbi:MAG: GNAT family N-acetyltransferase [Deinococcus-Thermus bacterium]|jgi:GNAT superfamily N-acetyltransferase|nr:GNAT family N-acetyltransferase [Deinococcota bacterium]